MFVPFDVAGLSRRAARGRGLLFAVRSAMRLPPAGASPGRGALGGGADPASEMEMRCAIARARAARVTAKSNRLVVLVAAIRIAAIARFELNNRNESRRYADTSQLGRRSGNGWDELRLRLRRFGAMPLPRHFWPRSLSRPRPLRGPQRFRRHRSILT